MSLKINAKLKTASGKQVKKNITNLKTSRFRNFTSGTLALQAISQKA